MARTSTLPDLNNRFCRAIEKGQPGYAEYLLARMQKVAEVIPSEDTADHQATEEVADGC